MHIIDDINTGNSPTGYSSSLEEQLSFLLYIMQFQLQHQMHILVRDWDLYGWMMWHAMELKTPYISALMME